ncbi:MAG: alginate export family protein [Fimbriimonadaceae bacterium]
MIGIEIMYIPVHFQDIKVNVKPYFDWRLRYERRLNRDFLTNPSGTGTGGSAPGSTDDDRTDLINRMRAGVEWNYGKEWSGEIQYQLASDSIRTSFSQTSDDFSDVNLAFAKYRHNNMSLTVGRQKINVGSERLLGTLEWSTAGRAYDGIRLQTGSWDAFAFKVGVALPKSNRTRVAGTTYKSSSGLTQVYFKHDGANGTPDTDVWTLAHAWQKKFDKFTPEAEVAVQSGNSAGRSLRSWALHGSLSYQQSSKTRFFVELNAASGGGNADTSYTFDNLLPTNHKFYGSMDMQSWRNMEEVAFGVEHQFDPKFGAKLHWHKFGLRDASDGWYGAGGGINRGALGAFIDPTGASGKDVGSEIDFELSYKLNPRTSFAGGFGIFTPGNFIKARNGGVADKQTWMYLMGQIRF